MLDDDEDDDDDDDDEEYIDDDSDFDEEKQEAELSMESFKSDVKDKDEYEIFKTTIYHLKQKYLCIINISLPDHIS